MVIGYRRYLAFAIGFLAGIYPIVTGEQLDEATTGEIVTAIGTLAAAGLALWSKLQGDEEA